MRTSSFSSFVHGTDEVTPMVTSEDSRRNNGAILPVTALPSEKAPLDVTAARHDRRLLQFLVLVVLLLVVMIVGIIVTAIVAVRLGRMEKEVERAQLQLPQKVKDALEAFRLSIGAQPFPQPFAPQVFPDTPPIRPEIHEPKGLMNQNLYTKANECPNQCQRKDFPNPPLVVLSMDGFARDYLRKFSVGVLDYMAKCGSTAEKVFPPFPTRTFPSHYTMVTGLYPESHGIVDNNIFDPAISDKVESMKRGDVDGFYQGDPIWNIYKRHGGRAHCLYWPGCGYNISGLRPDVTLPYNKDLPFRNRFDMIVDWLLLPPKTRPGLITAYLDQPDSAGHYQIDDEDIESQLAILDVTLSKFFERLDNHGLLSCINFVIVSDHGMQRINNTNYISEMVQDSGIIPASGVIGRIYKHNSQSTVEKLMEPFECDQGKKWKVFQRGTIPTRKHYQKMQRVGDVIIEGKLGTAFYGKREDDWKLSGDHGYDYIQAPMQTIFFAMGPSIKRGVVLPPIQTIQYLNLFIDLLGLPHNVPNNGTLGIMDDILVRPPLRTPQFHFPITECMSIGASSAIGCSSCPDGLLMKLNENLKCIFPPNFPFQISSTTARCIQNYCEKSVITSGGPESAVAVAERLVRRAENSSTSCEFLNLKYSTLCKDRKNPSDHLMKSISADTQSEFATIRTLMLPWKKGFISDILDPLNEYTQSLLQKFDHLVSMTGTANDHNYDGIEDADKSSAPTHIYRVLVACSGAWSSDGASCAKASDTMVLPFIFPVMDKDVNCLPKDQLLLEYTARLYDVEAISGLVFQFPGLSHMELLRLKTNVTTQLW